MKNLFKLMLLTITMFIAGTSFALAGNDNDSIKSWRKPIKATLLPKIIMHTYFIKPQRKKRLKNGSKHLPDRELPIHKDVWEYFTVKELVAKETTNQQ